MDNPISVATSNHQIPFGETVMSEYNISGGITNLGEDILVMVLSEMSNSRDVQQFLTTCRAFAHVTENKLFHWAISKTVANHYPPTKVPTDKVSIVSHCFHNL